MALPTSFNNRPQPNSFGDFYDELLSYFSSFGLENGAVTNAKLATDVKIGSLATLTTTEKNSIVGALNEIDSHADSAVSAAGAKYTKPAEGIPSTDMTAAVIASLGLANTALQNMTFVNGTPVNAAAATGALTLTGVVIDGELITIGTDDYEFAADTAQSVASGKIAIDITSYATKAQGTLTVDTQPTAGDTMTLGSKTFTFVPNGTANANGEISIGTGLATAKTNIVAAINGSDGYNLAHTQVSAAAFSNNNSVITALIGGTAGNNIASTETFTEGTNIFTEAIGVTTAGADCTAANAVTAIVAAITNSGDGTYSAVDGTNDVVDITFDVNGIVGNSISTTETMANATFAHGTLTGGVDGTVGTQWQSKVDTGYFYLCIATNDSTGKNWRRISLGTAY